MRWFIERGKLGRLSARRADTAGETAPYYDPPAPVRELTRELSGIDITRTGVQIDARTICARFVFAKPPGDIDFQVTVSLRDASTSSCCTSLRFRRTSGQLEVGYDAYDANGETALKPVSRAGAELGGNTLVVTGTFPPPNSWLFASRRMPTAENIGWSVTTGYFPEKYGPYFGDWLPRHEAANHPLIRHRNGATIRPGATP